MGLDTTLSDSETVRHHRSGRPPLVAAMFRGATSAGAGSIGIRSSGETTQPGTDKGAFGTTATTAKPRAFFFIVYACWIQQCQDFEYRTLGGT